MKPVKIFIDNRKYEVNDGQSISQAARALNVFIPGLCDFKGLRPAGTCRICTCKVNGNYVAACTTQVEDGMRIENDTEELNDIRKAIVEMLYVEGNHQCAVCEKSGNCELQALAYRYQILVPRFPYQFPVRQVESPDKKIMLDTNRCIQCLRCIRGAKTPEGRPVFKMKRVNKTLSLTIAEDVSSSITDEVVQELVDLCPVGAILRHDAAFTVPIGKRKYDNKAIGS